MLSLTALLNLYNLLDKTLSSYITGRFPLYLQFRKATPKYMMDFGNIYRLFHPHNLHSTFSTTKLIHISVGIQQYLSRVSQSQTHVAQMPSALAFEQNESFSYHLEE